MTTATMADWNPAPRSRERGHAPTRTAQTPRVASRRRPGAYNATAVTAAVSWDAIRQHEEQNRER